MRPLFGERSWDANTGGTTATEDIPLLSPAARTKSDDYPVVTNARPPEPPLVFGSHDAAPNTAALDDLFSRSTNPPRQQGNALTNPPRQQGTDSPAQSGGGVPSGVSTPNTGAGGSGASSSGAGPAVTNASQFLSAYLNMVGSALPPGTVPAMTVGPDLAVQPAVPTASPMPRHASRPAMFSVLNPEAKGAPPPSPPAPPPPANPVSMFDMNTGESLPNNVTANSFAGYNLDLLTQTGPPSPTYYTWDLSKAPDLTNVSGQGTMNLQGTWASFTGGPRTETITLTETPSGNTWTETYLLSGTSSPAYAATPPTNSGTWPTILPPDKVLSNQASVAIGPYASAGLADGSVQTSFAMPSYNPNVAPLGLVYITVAADPHPVFQVLYLEPTLPSVFSAQLSINGTAFAPVYYVSCFP
jgi:hypothetical protein